MFILLNKLVTTMFSKYHKLIHYIVIFFAIITFIWLCKALFLTSYPDFSDYYIGAQHIFLRVNPYLPDSRYFTQQVYPPFALITYLPLLLVPYTIAAKIWVALSIAAAILSVYYTAKVFNIKKYSSLNLFLAGLLFISFPLKFTLGMGQINTFILLLITLSFYFLNTKKEKASGVFYAIPVLLKFFAVLLLPYFLYIKKWNILLSFIITVLVATIIVTVFMPLPIFINYYVHILPGLLSSWKGDYYNQALSGFLMRSIPDATVRSYLRIIISALFLLITALPILKSKKKTQRRINMEIAAIITLSVIINNFSWQHHFVFLLLPYLITVYTIITTKGKNKNRTKLFFLIFISYLLIAANLPNPSIVPAILRSHVFYGGVALWGIIVTMLLRFKFD